MGDKYGIVVWWRKSYSYDWDDRIKIENTFEKTTNESIDKVYDKIIEDAISKAPTDGKANALKSLKSNRNFMVNHKTDIEEDSTFQNDLKEKFLLNIQTTARAELEKYTLSDETENDIVNDFVGRHEVIKISAIPKGVRKEVDSRIEEEWKQERMPSIVEQASEEVLGRTISTEDELRNLWRSEEITWGQYLKTRIRFKSIAIGGG